MQTQSGAFYWNELMTRDADQAKAFYGAVCGWSFQEMEVDGIDYILAMVGEQPVGGIFAMSGPEFEGVPEHWACYVAVDDADQAVAAATASGGQVIRPPFDVTGVGRIAILQDNGGAVIGVMKPASMPDA